MIFGSFEEHFEPFARDLAKELVRRLPPARLESGKDNDVKLKSTIESAMAHVQLSASGFRGAQKVSSLERLRNLTQTFQKEMATLGYGENFIRATTLVLVGAMTTESVSEATDDHDVSPEARVEEGNVLYRAGNVEAAIASYLAAVAIDPSYARAHFNLGVALHRLNRVDESITHYARAVASRPDFSQALVNWGNVLKDRGDLDAAATQYLRAQAIDPGDVHALNNLGSIAVERGDIDAARTLYSRAAEVDPSYVDARHSLGLIALGDHDFENGWMAYELRFRTDPPAASIGTTRLPRLTLDELLNARRVSIRKEQGIGDQILFSTLLPQVVARGISAVVELDSRLVGIYRRSLPDLEFVAIVDPDREFEEYDFHLPLGSLPGLFRRTLSSFAAQPEALLLPDEARADAMSARLRPGPKIGISWRSFQGIGRAHVAHRKSMPLECFAALDDGSLQLLDLQYGEVDAERRDFDSRHRGFRVAIEGLDLFGDLDGLVSAISLCDLVVTTSSVTAHLAGAIGKRTWLVYLAANPPFHYWAPGPDGRSLWYPSVEVITDAKWTTWNTALESVAARWARERRERQCDSRGQASQSARICHQKGRLDEKG